MPTITSAGVGSGIDVEGLITGLMEAESLPLNNLESKKSRYQIELSAFGQLKSQMSSLRDSATTLGDSAKFGKYTATSSDEEVFTATTTSGTISEEHDINVLALATEHRMTSAAFLDQDAAVGTGTYSFSSGDNSFYITIDTDSDSLKGLRDAINDAADNTSISASIINVDGGSRLILTAKEGGTANTITAPGVFSELTAATDASLEIDGFTTTSSSNTINDVIPGISLELKSVGAASLTSNRDMEAIETTLDEFVSAYNSLRINIATLSEGTLQGDSMPRGVEFRLRQEFFNEITIDGQDSITAYDLGFTFDKEGVLTIDEDKLSTATAENLDAFINAFTDNDNGFAGKIVDNLTEYTQAGGFIDNREDGIESRRSALDLQIERMEYRLEQIEERYRKQFTAMDALVSQLQSGTEYLLSQLSNE